MSFTDPFPFVNNEVLRQELMRRYGLIKDEDDALDSRLDDLEDNEVIPSGTATDSVLRWDGTDWVESTDVRVTASGNVGIGETNPVVNLHLKGNTPGIRIEGTNLAGGGGRLQFFTQGTAQGTIRSGEALGNAITFSANGGGTERMRIDANGNVGINTDSPSEVLTVQTPTLNPPSIELKTGFGVINGEHGLKFAGNGSVQYHTSDQYMAFETNSVERMRIDSSGFVGIGTTSPSQNLHVNSGASNLAAKFESTDTQASISFVDNTTGGDFTVMVGAVGDDLNLVAGGSSRARILGNGNVGIGDLNPAHLLSVAGEVQISRTTAGDQGILFSMEGGGNFIKSESTSGNPKFLRLLSDTNGDGIRYETTESTADHQWFIGASEKMRLTSAGKLGIGTSVPAAGLEVDGSFIGVGDFGVGLRIYADTDWARMDLVGNTVATTDSFILIQDESGNATIRNTFDDKTTDIRQDGAGFIRLLTNGQIAQLIEGNVNNRTSFYSQTGTNENRILIEPGRSSDTVMAIWSNATTVPMQIGLFNGGNTQNLNLYAQGTGNVVIHAGGSPRLYVSDAGRVGIATLAPDSDLHVDGSNATLRVGNTTGSPLGFTVNDGGGNASIVFNNFGTTVTTAGRNAARIAHNSDGSTNSRIDFRTASGGSIPTDRFFVGDARVEVTNSVFRLPRFSSDPTGAATGDIYFNTATNVVRVYNGTAWVNV